MVTDKHDEINDRLKYEYKMYLESLSKEALIEKILNLSPVGRGDEGFNDWEIGN